MPLLWNFRSAPLCQAVPVFSLLVDDFRGLEEVLWESGAGVEDFDADEAVVSPVEHDERLDTLGRPGLDAGRATRREGPVSEVDVDGIGLAVIGDLHSSILPLLSVTSWR